MFTLYAPPGDPVEPPQRAGPQAFNKIAGTFDEQFERALTPRPRLRPGRRAEPTEALAARVAELDGYWNMMTRQALAGYVGTCVAIRNADFTDAARRIEVPTLCVVGDQDGSTPPALVRSLAALIPGSRFEIIRDAGHIPCVEQPEALTALIRDFVASLAPGAENHG